MRKIIKGVFEHLAQWKRREPDLRCYKDLGDDQRCAIRDACMTEQKGLCAFCCMPINQKTAHNAHIKAQARYPQNSLDWDNIVASCKKPDHCGVKQGSADIPLTPLMDECETELRFYQSGSVKGLTERAQKTIDVLGLNCDALREQRKKAIHAFLYGRSYFPPEEDILEWPSEVLKEIAHECLREENGRLLPYAPVLANIVNHKLQDTRA